MDWLKPQLEQETPTPEQIQQMWQTLEIQPEPCEYPAALAYMEEICLTHVNGGVVLGQFLVKGDQTLEWYAARQSLEIIDFFDQFVCDQAVIAALPGLRIQKPLRQQLRVEFKRSGSFTLDGELGFTLFQGGAYEQFKRSAKEAKNLAREFCDQLFSDRYDQISVYKTDLAWTEWFSDVAWDQTWFIVDRRDCRVWLLCITDTD
ncbi:MAG: hypothetical protein SFT94_09230 [Pseudanabaenaceae cyanobacterium bins.68]|nr:hypothetical protein [Pseudanabaenaceae cyanobacterium bins.68]